tara:strand:- start:3647 stop:4927 length:1281 start_codon:yes stop_codon:yes gene_type:complete
MLHIFLISSALFVFIIYKKTRGELVNSFVMLFFVSFVFYNGWAITDEKVTAYYVSAYLIFLCVFVLSFIFFYKIFYKVGRSSNLYFNDLVENKLKKKILVSILLIYFSVSLFPLIYPDFKVLNLLSPPEIDLREHFSKRSDVINGGVLISIVSFINILIFPLFLICLQRYYKKISIIVFLLMVIFYIEFVATGYKSRGQLLATLFPVLFLYWHENPSKRLYIVILSALAAPFVFILFAFYTDYRLGGGLSLSDYSLLESISYIFESETSFVLNAGLPLIESGKHVDLAMYFKWIVTLPIPKFIIGSISGARLNSEISEIVLGVNEGGIGYYIVLPGLVAESVYVYGSYFFWLHAISIGAVIAFMARVFFNNRKIILLSGYVAFVSLYNFNRAGMAAFLPIAINGFIVIYIIYFLYRFGVLKVENRT